MPDETKESAPQWAIIELMGHIRYGGLVSKDNQFGTAMLRVDVPQADGSFVSQLINPASLYRITMCAEELARAAAKAGDPKPMNQWELRHLLPPAATQIGKVPEDFDGGHNDPPYHDDDLPL